MLIKNVKVYDTQSKYHGQRVHVHIAEGLIQDIQVIQGGGVGKRLVSSAQEVLEGGDLGLSPSWVDLWAHFCDPGEEYCEDVHTGLGTARAGGFSGVALLPDTIPTVQTKSHISYLYQRARGQGVDVYPLAALSVDREGRVLSDMQDLHQAGAYGFTDGDTPVWNAHLMLQALRYARAFGGLILHKAEDLSLSRAGIVHEGEANMSLGLPGIPALAEDTLVYRDLRLLEYASGEHASGEDASGRLHFSCVSSATSLGLIEAAVRKGLAVSADVTAQHLFFDEHCLHSFDPQHKLSPPYRSTQDRKALCAAVRKGIISVLVSAHMPRSVEQKALPFAEAAPGVMALQTVFPILNSLRKELPLEHSLPCLYDGPRRVLGLPIPTIAVGEKASLTLFDTQHAWVLDEKSNHSKSRNSPFYGQSLQGAVRALFHKNRCFTFSP